MDNKIEIFETIVHKLKDWFMQQNKMNSIEDFNNNNDFSILKLIKLHFFVTAINSNEDNTLINRFDFFAMPYGPVETDIYSQIKISCEFSNFSIDNFKANFTENIPSKTISPDLITSIDASIKSIKEIDSSFINADAGSLVELTHKWNSWKTIYEEARNNGIYSKPIPRELIKKDNKILNLELA
ncbi:DUF4065 domain-containing protein [Flavobacterium sp. LHD-80]|uniref:type II toxin-antitoxin system antitoxin SocA domain-containing protein n=1 Tax=Flavobacterium sp. LHD-80 TaxID=3071411 RepID=UPI0027DFBB47|nr:type II toxin-antitoxin system antitoxin SocA domain-containing protein [Flavobacterium sp. LHD-80]MDQ6471154.1 DUF4065 domain-containing protein [Flavobacterium sp. LHD-80]